MKQRLDWQQLGIAAGVMFLNVASNVIATLVASSSWVILLIFLAAAAVAAAVYWFAKPRLVEVVMRPPKILRTQHEFEQSAYRGLIVCVSLYKHAGSTGTRKEIEESHQAARERDYARLDFPNSNLNTILAAVRTHQTRLEHCWLISTTGSEKGSERYTPALVRYLQSEFPNCQFHYEDYTIPLNDDALITVKTQEMVNTIFKEANQHSLTDEQIIADITGGMRSISLGVTLACLDGHRKVQFMGTGYDANGNVTGTPFPIILDYEPRLVQK